MVCQPYNRPIFPIVGQEATLAELKDLILAGGCEVVCEKGDLKRCLEDTADVLVVLICEAARTSKDVVEAVELASDNGKRIVGVWGEGEEEKGLPAILNRLGSGTVPMDADQIASVICNCRDEWLAPGGNIRKAPPTPRHRG